MDKSWISKPRNTSEYVNGLLGFLDFAFANGSSDNRIRCPCSDCKCIEWQLRAVVYDHLLVRPFPKGYTIWLLHGERDIGGSSTQQEIQHNSYTGDSMRDLIKDAFNKQGHHGNVEPVAQDEVNNNDRVEGNQTDRVEDHLTDEARQVNELIRDGEQELYEGCTKFSKLSFLIKLYHIKCMTMMTDKSLSMIIELLHDAFAGFAAVPTSLYEAKKTIKKLGLSYEKIHACPNNCMLYRGTKKDLESCEKCGTSRWHTEKKTQAAKVLRYFPLIPRLQRLFMSRKTSEDMRWHDVGGNKDGLLRHPRDGESWKKFDLRYPEFAKESRNIRLGFASDGFNPFGNMSTNYSIWPVVLIPYNTAPWICMRQTSFLLSMIIPGSKMPGNDIDIYLQPLIDELKELWVGVQTFDTLRNETFNMRAALMWTVSDFPGLGILSGWNIHKGLACPVCNHDAEVCRLPHSAKWCFCGSRRFLRPGHKFRLDKVRFNGKVDKRSPPPRLSGSEIWKQVENIENSFGKAPEVPRSEKRRRTQENVIPVTHNWTKQNVFFQLVYWKFHLLPHNLDLMHIEKNVCDNVIFTLLNETGKSKDHLKARKDLEAMGIREDLWPDENGKYKSAIFTMSPKQKDLFLTTLKNIRVPDGYSSNISRCVDLKQRKLFGLKSHDCHILMEQLLPIALRNVMPGIVCAVITDLCSFFQKLTSKVIDPTDLDNLQDQIVLTLCHMEMIFPPSFFTVMIHLVVHLVEEVKLGGPESYRWMYFMERYLGRLKSYVRNKAQPEGSIAEGYLADEALTFCSRYLTDIETRINRPSRVDDEPVGNDLNVGISLFPKAGRAVGGGSNFTLTPLEKLQAHRHVLVNCPAVDEFYEECKSETKRRLRRTTRLQSQIDKVVHREFVKWFSDRISNDVDGAHSDEIKFLALGPLDQAKRYSAYNVNGFKFRVLSREQGRGLKTQNSGVFAKIDTMSYASSRDRNARVGAVPYYGKLVDIIELNYHGVFKVTLFKCQWANTTTHRGFRKDDLGFTSVNFSQQIHIGDQEDHEPYMLETEAQLVYYVEDVVDKEWSVVVHLKPRDLFDMGEEQEEERVYNNVPFEQQDLERWFKEANDPQRNGNLRLSRADDEETNEEPENPTNEEPENQTNEEPE